MDSLQERWTGLRTTSIATFIKNVKYFKGLLDGTIVEDSTDAQEFGTLQHMYVLERDKFKENYTTLEYDKPSNSTQLSFCSFVAENLRIYPDTDLDELCVEAYKNCYKTEKKSDKLIAEESKKLYNNYKDYIRFSIYNNKEIISFPLLKFLKDTYQTIKDHKLASKLMIEDPFSTEKHYNETLVYWEFPQVLLYELPIVVKSTIDKLTIDHGNKVIKLVDLKTTSDIAEFSEHFKEYPNYRIQLACYWYAVEAFFKEQFPDKNINEYLRETYLVVVQSKNKWKELPVNCEVFPVSDKTLQEGFNIIEEALKDIAWHFENDKWDHARSYYEGNGANETL
jgi:hypothetical protein